jgi:hypothetical protein
MFAANSPSTACNRNDMLYHDTKTNIATKCVNIKDSAIYKEKLNKDNHKILLIGDSHIKRCAIELRQILDYGYDVLGFSKPSAKMSDILETMKNEIASLSNNDIDSVGWS